MASPLFIMKVLKLIKIYFHTILIQWIYELNCAHTRHLSFFEHIDEATTSIQFFECKIQNCVRILLHFSMTIIPMLHYICGARKRNDINVSNVTHSKVRTYRFVRMFATKSRYNLDMRTGYRCGPDRLATCTRMKWNIDSSCVYSSIKGNINQSKRSYNIIIMVAHVKSLPLLQSNNECLVLLCFPR